MRTMLLAVVFVAIAAYGYGVYSHAHRSFPVEEIGALKRLILPDRGRPTAEADGSIFKDTSGRRQVSCGSLPKDAAVILVMGQSNAANYGETRRQAKADVYNFSWLDGRCYHAEDPLLGTTGEAGSIWTRLGDTLIERGAFRTVLFIPVAVGGSSVRDWAGDHGPAARAAAAAQSLARQGMKITHVLWQQGAADKDTAKPVYARLFSTLANYLRGAGIHAPIFVATETICANRGLDHIRSAQRELPLLLSDVFPGPDADSLDRISDRLPDGCHYSERGLDTLARMWSDVLIKYNTEMLLSAHRSGNTDTR